VRAIDLRCLERWSAKRRKAPLKQMGVDEIHMGKKVKFITVVSNLETGEPLWFGPERKKGTLDEFFRTQLRSSQRSNIEAACVDMWQQFTDSITEWAPGCRIWQKDQVVIIDDDLGLSGASTDKRSGFARMISEVALGHVGIILGLEGSRLARNNADWYRLLELCGLTDTLIGDNDGVYHPALFNDRLLLGLKGTMSETELHIIRARLDGGIRNKAARGELRRGLPVGFVWGEAAGEVLFHPDEAVTAAIRSVFRPLRRVRLGAPRLALAAFEAPSFRYRTARMARFVGSFRLTPRSITS
jgi:DNA invertase Pin-like site-specific DNA recombinase